ncbi:Nem1-Spo7 phosphatase regulatory subunit [Ceratocystis pirilliformis]|uniref:Nem1-Spo7 phosphatase regulatory subunit n=1 Tax=Ceratocystis pirilliformis TaxID=259994 RepID=A0ABR3ZLE8_9PEZI
MADDFDSIVKGALQTQIDVKSVSGTTFIKTSPGTPTKPWDPLSTTPSSPPMIYLNLLVLEASLRAQYLELRARRRHHTFFLLLLSAWIVGFGYALFFAPREDGIGVGGSVYWGVEAGEKVCFMGGVITSILVWATGIWDRGIRWPRRWFNVSNRGLRGFNCKLVIIKRSWWAEMASTIGFFLTYGLFSHTASSSYRFVDAAILREVDRELYMTDVHSTVHNMGVPGLSAMCNDENGHEEDLAPAGDFVKLLLHAKPFSPSFREDWEIYRSEYWDKENERRAHIRAKLRARNRQYAKNRWGIFWWLPWHHAQTERHFARIASSRAAHLYSNGDANGALSHSAKGAQHHRSRSIRRGSVSSTRSLTPTRDSVSPAPMDGALLDRARRGSISLEMRRGKRLSVSSTTNAGGVLGSTSRKKPAFPETPSPLARESVLISDCDSKDEMDSSEKTKPAKRRPAITKG